MSNKGLLLAIAVILLGILGFLVIDAAQKSPAEQMAGASSNVTASISNTID